jgi:hypothetical protein
MVGGVMRHKGNVGCKRVERVEGAEFVKALVEKILVHIYG